MVVLGRVEDVQRDDRLAEAILAAFIVHPEREEHGVVDARRLRQVRISVGDNTVLGLAIAHLRVVADQGDGSLVVERRTTERVRADRLDVRFVEELAAVRAAGGAEHRLLGDAEGVLLIGG